MEALLVPMHRRVLIVDDYPDAAESLALLLSCHGHEAIGLHSVRRMIELARDFRPDAIVLEPALREEPGGLALARMLRAQPRFDGVLLVALSGRGTDQDKQAAREAGFDHYFLKPAKEGELLALIEQPAAARVLPAGRVHAVHSFRGDLSHDSSQSPQP